MDREGRQELHYRALEGDVPGIRDRLAAGDDIALADRQGFTALHFAAQQSQADAVEALLGAGAPVDPRDQFGNTPLWRAIFDSRGQVDTVKLLLGAGADPDLLNNAGASPRDLAQRIAGAEDVVALLSATPQIAVRRARALTSSVLGMSTGSERKAAREAVGAYHEACLAELVRYVGEAVDRFRAGELDAFAVDDVMFQYSRAAKELWKFCNCTDVVFTATLVRDQPQVDWWERGARKRP